MLSAFKNFFVTFLIAAIVFGGAAYFATHFLTDTITGIFDAEASELDSLRTQEPNQEQTPVTQPPDTGTDPVTDEVEGTSFNMLFIVTDYQPDIFSDYLPAGDALNALENATGTNILGADYRRPRACAVLLFRADKERHEFTITSFASATRLETASGAQSMADLYNLYGTDYILSTVSSLTGLTIDHYLLVNVTELYDIVNDLGGVSMYILSDIYYNGMIATTTRPSDEEIYALPRLYTIGKTTVDGAGTIALMMLEEYNTGVSVRNTLVTDFFRALMTKLVAKSEAELSAFYDSICESSLVETTFSPKDMVAQIELIRSFGQDGFTTTVLTYPGRFVAATETEDAYFEPDITAGRALYTPYRPYDPANSKTK